jgi:hypothetical protein
MAMTLPQRLDVFTPPVTQSTIAQSLTDGSERSLLSADTDVLAHLKRSPQRNGNSRASESRDKLPPSHDYDNYGSGDATTTAAILTPLSVAVTR